MHKLLLAAAVAAGSLAVAPAFAQDTECPPGTTANAGDPSGVTCAADDNKDDTTGMTDDTSAGRPLQSDQDNPLSDNNTGGGNNGDGGGNGGGNGDNNN